MTLKTICVAGAREIESTILRRSKFVRVGPHYEHTKRKIRVRIRYVLRVAILLSDTVPFFQKK